MKHLFHPILTEQKCKLYLRIFFSLLFFTVFVFFFFKYSVQLTQLVHDPKAFKAYLLSFGAYSILVFILFQILQVVFVAIPGEFVQVAGGYVYGTFAGSMLSLIGIMLGSLIAFVLARLLGYPLVKSVIRPKMLARFEFLLNDAKAELSLFILFLIPGFPKDVLTYIAGITPLKPYKFFIIASIARLPGIFMSSYIGSTLHSQQYGVAIAVSGLALLAFVGGLLKKERILKRIHKNRNEA